MLDNKKMKGSSTRQLGVVRRKGKKKSNPMDNVIAAKAWDLYFLEYGSPYGSHVHQKCTPAMLTGLYCPVTNACLVFALRTMMQL